MSPPIRDGSGNDIGAIRLGDGSEIAEVRTGAGDVLFSAIPDIVESGLSHRYTAKAQSDASTLVDQQGSKDLTGSATLQSSGINGLQTIDYNGTDDEHSDSTPTSLGNGDVYAIGAVIRPDTTGGSGGFWSNGDANGYNFLQDSGPDWRYEHKGISSQRGGTPDTNPHAVVVSYDGSTLIVEIDKTQIINASIGLNSPSNLSQFSLGSLGGSNYANFGLGEYLHYTESKNSTERDEIGDYLIDEWGL